MGKNGRIPACFVVFTVSFGLAVGAIAALCVVLCSWLGFGNSERFYAFWVLFYVKVEKIFSGEIGWNWLEGK